MSSEGYYRLVDDAPTEYKPPPVKTAARTLFVDWLRSIAIYGVVSAHVMVSVPRVLPTTEVEQAKINGTLRCFMQYGLPIFFYCSGRGSAFTKDSLPVFVWKKAVRLLLPLIIGLNLVVMPTSYIGRSYRPCAAHDIDNFFEYWYDFWVNQFGCGGFEWLWFLPVLFGITVVTAPLVIWMLRRNRHHLACVRPLSNPYIASVAIPSPSLNPSSSSPLSSSSSSSPANSLSLEAPPTVVPRFVTDYTKYRPVKQEDFVFMGLQLLFSLLLLAAFLFLNISPWFWAIFFVCIVLISISILYLPQLRERGWMYMVALVPVVTNLAFSLFPVCSTSGARTLVMVMFYAMLYLQGFIVQLFDAELQADRFSPQHKAWKPLGLFVLFGLIGVTSPTTERNVGYLFTFPLYEDPFFRFCYLIGSYLFIYLLTRWGEMFYNEKLSEWQYRHLTQSSVVVYVFHWLFLDIFNVLIIRPLKDSLNVGCTLLVTFVCCCLCCWLLYYGILNVPPVAFVFGVEPKKKKKKKPLASAPETVAVDA
eukprot:GILI01008098.1.p1 GENE.GILI01008098.1~~GILI01008098.1.p1  ORF type:complete len:532 (-),score=139.27 GILI01008098.1:1383-2978(-)